MKVAQAVTGVTLAVALIAALTYASVSRGGGLSSEEVGDKVALLLRLVDEWQELDFAIVTEAPGPMRSTRRKRQAAILSRISSEIDYLSESEIPASVIRFILQQIRDGWVVTYTPATELRAY